MSCKVKKNGMKSTRFCTKHSIHQNQNWWNREQNCILCFGFYNPNFEIKENSNKNKDSSKIILYVLLIISLCVIVVGIGFFIKMKFYPSVLKKKRANELDDEYEYVSHKNNTNNNDNNNDNDNQLFNNSINSE